MERDSFIFVINLSHENRIISNFLGTFLKLKLDFILSYIEIILHIYVYVCTNMEKCVLGYLQS